ncbi:MAG: thioredoxin family protein [Gaiellaceae bacterium]
MRDEAGSEGRDERQTAANAAAKPLLVFFHTTTSGRCRRAEAHLAHALQRRHNHDVFEVVRVDVEERPDLARRFRIEQVPTLLVVEGRRVAHRIVSPRSATELEQELAAWLR